MAQVKKSWQDYMTASFGSHGQVKPGTNALEIGAAAQGGGIFERLPIGTSASGTAVLVDLIGAESFSVSVGTITTLVSGTVAKVTNLAAGTVTKLEGGTLGVLAAGSVVTTAGTVTTQLAGTQELLGTAKFVGTVGVLNAGTVTMGAGTITTQLAGTQEKLGTVNYMGTCGTLSAFPLISGEDQTNDVLKVEPQMSYSHYTIGSGTVKSAAGFLHAVSINTLATCPVTIYDAVGTAAATIASYAASATPQTFIYDVKCPTGITIASTTAAACDFTVSYR